VKRSSRVLLILLLALPLVGCAGSPEIAAPGVSLTIDPSGEPQQVSTGIQLLILITVLSLAPAVLALATSFTRIVIVFSLLRNALGTPSAPPTQVIVGLSLLLTFFVMAPVYQEVEQEALVPYMNSELDQETAFNRAIEPIREFMFAHAREQDIELFLSVNDYEQPETLEDIPTVALMPAFVISELRAAFIMGFMLYVPFLVIDLVVSSILLAMGMMMLPPSLVSLPFKILLFVMVDGWYLVTRSLLLSFS
jgi:flagellar biosynthetic protein FliP